MPLAALTKAGMSHKILYTSPPFFSQGRLPNSRRFIHTLQMKEWRKECVRDKNIHLCQRRFQAMHEAKVLGVQIKR